MNGLLYCVYLLRCGDGSLYCGIAADLQRRVREHREGKGARYTASHLPVELEFATSYWFGRAEAQAVEKRVKRLRRGEKKHFLEKVERARLGRKSE
ncbi:MAG: GIY-YIG nuclease family protein [Synergistaceae bacterium]|jgi:putative endonuclease|nr:GIY-YIG nuclease family protein [Synergistaceae bacterium]